MRAWRWAIGPLAVVSVGGCFATRQDMQILQNDFSTMRAENHQADSARRIQIDRALAQIGEANDSIAVLSHRVVKGLGDVRGDLYAMSQQLIQIQELTGQSQQRLQELRGKLEQRQQSLTPPPAVGPVASTPAQPGDTSHQAVNVPGPNQLYQLALDQLRRGSTKTARAGFQDLLDKYPNADIAPDAQFYVAEAYQQEDSVSAADSVYQLVVNRYPASPRASTSLFKHATTLLGSGKTQAARAALEDVVRRYPQSDEAVLAKDRLRDLK
jgi:tol-pal system protein YbgF